MSTGIDRGDPLGIALRGITGSNMPYFAVPESRALSPRNLSATGRLREWVCFATPII
jgi:hypothetical protein